MSLIEYLDRSGKHVRAKTFNKYRDEKHNFSSWWYSAKKRREGGLINFMFDILFILYGGDPSLLKYVEVSPPPRLVSSMD